MPSGTTGEAKPLSAWKPSDYHSLAFDPTNADVVFFGYHNGLLRSADGGATWQPVKQEPNWDAMSLAIPARSPGTLYAAGHGLLKRSTNGGQSWQDVSQTLPGTDIHALAASPEDTKRLFAFVVGHGLFRSGDSGTSWQRAAQGVPADTMALAAPAGNASVLLVGSMQGGLLRSQDVGATWLRVAEGFSGRSVMALAAAPGQAGLVYAATDVGLWRSDDAGQTWALVNPAERPMVLAVHPTVPRRLISVDGAGRVRASGDGGATWRTAG